MTRVGVLSGTFDPFHIAHLEACLVARAACELDVIAIMIEKKPRRKINVTSYKHRLAIVDLALQQHPSIRILDPEVDNVTAQSALKVLHQQFGNAKFHYIFGSDILEHMSGWPQLEMLVTNFTFCVVLRSNKDESVARKHLANLSNKFSQLEYKLLPAVWSPVSSSKIRDEIRSSGYSEYIHRDVLKYVLRHKLY